MVIKTVVKIKQFYGANQEGGLNNAVFSGY